MKSTALEHTISILQLAGGIPPLQWPLVRMANGTRCLTTRRCRCRLRRRRRPPARRPSQSRDHRSRRRRSLSCPAGIKIII